MRHRAAFRTSVAFLVPGLLAALLAAGCGGASSSSPSASSSAAGTPKKGGTLTLAYQSEPTTLDPGIAWNIIDWEIEHCVYESLYRFAAKPGEAGTQLEPAIAADMPQISNRARPTPSSSSRESSSSRR